MCWGVRRRFDTRSLVSEHAHALWQWQASAQPAVMQHRSEMQMMYVLHCMQCSDDGQMSTTELCACKSSTTYLGASMRHAVCSMQQICGPGP